MRPDSSVQKSCRLVNHFRTSGIPIRVLVQGALDGVPAGHTYGLKAGVQQFKWCLVFFARMDRHM
jgi:hypothetical protein